MSDNPKRLYIPNSGPRRFVVDAVAMLVYLVVVWAWGMSVQPLGRDYAALADPATLPAIARTVFGWEITLFEGWAHGYHIVNMLLLYGCMLAVYRFVRVAVPGPFWLGTLAAALFMANPVHTEAVLNLSGIGDLIPALLALAALAAYAEYARDPRAWKYILALALFAAALLPYGQNLGLAYVVVLYDAVALKTAWRRWVPRVLPVLFLGGLSMARQGMAGFADGRDLAEVFTPLYLVFYPIGLLPETAYAFHQHPWLGWAAAGAVVAVTALICMKARRRVIVFGLLSMAAMRLGPSYFVDPVHMTGGGTLLVANALFNVALVGLFYRIAEHPKWRRPVIMLTTLLAVVFFATQIVFITHWREASRVVKYFQSAAAASAVPVGILPDYRAYRGAPVGLSESISHDTPFSRRIDHVPLLPLHYVPPEEHVVQVAEWQPVIVCRVEANPLVKVVPWPFDLLNAGNVVTMERSSVVLREKGEGHAVYEIRPDVSPASFLSARGATYPAMAQASAIAPAAGEPEKGAQMETADANGMTPEQRQLLEEADWVERVGESAAVWVSVSEQVLRVIDNGTVVWQAKCSTAEKGVGSKKDSYQTPLGWHSVAEKVGAGEPWGRVFREKKASKKVWQPGETTKKDLVLTRVLALTGEEPGKNKGGDVDSYTRCIYIHGTNDEERVGTPVSHGCVRLRNDDVIRAFEMIPMGAKVLITE